MIDNGWDIQHQKYKETDWINKPSIFSEQAIEYFPENGKILDVGCGQGQDSRFFASKNYTVIGIDSSEEGIKIANQKSIGYKNLSFFVADISLPLPFDSESFDVVYSHLAVHYFDKEITHKIFNELRRILKAGGILAVFVNSVNDPEYGIHKKIEEDYFLVGDMKKRYFSADSLNKFLAGYEILLLDESGETYKDRAISVNNLVLLIAKKI